MADLAQNGVLDHGLAREDGRHFIKNTIRVGGKYVSTNIIRICSAENCNIYPQESPLNTIEAAAAIDAKKFGDLIRSAFVQATSHPERKK